MDNGMCRIVGFLCLGASACGAYIAFDRYQTNANNVRAIQSSRLATMLGHDKLEPATPAESKYAMLIGALFGLGGVLLLVRARSGEPGEPTAPARRRRFRRSSGPKYPPAARG